MCKNGSKITIQLYSTLVKRYKGCSPWSASSFGGEGVTLIASFKKKFNNELIKEFCISISVVKRIA